MKLAGGGDWPPEQQQQMQIVPPHGIVEPPAADWLPWATGVLVPLAVAIIGLWAACLRSEGRICQSFRKRRD